MKPMFDILITIFCFSVIFLGWYFVFNSDQFLKRKR